MEPPHTRLEHLPGVRDQTALTISSAASRTSSSLAVVEMEQQVEHVARVELRAWKAIWLTRFTGRDADPFPDDLLARFGSIRSCLPARRRVHDDRSGYRSHHLPGDQVGARLPGTSRGGDAGVGRSQLLEQKIPLLAGRLGRDLLGVPFASSAFSSRPTATKRAPSSPPAP